VAQRDLMQRSLDVRRGIQPAIQWSVEAAVRLADMFVDGVTSNTHDCMEREYLGVGSRR
jgi:hypothetical protein